MVQARDAWRWLSLGGFAEKSRNRHARRVARSFEALETRAVMDGGPFGGGGDGPYQEPGELESLSAGQILQLLVNLDLTTKNSVGELVQTLDFDEVFTAMTNEQLLESLLDLDLVRSHTSLTSLVEALPAAGVDLDILRLDGLLTALTTARGGNLLTDSAVSAKASLESQFASAPLNFLNVFDPRSLLELFDDRILSTTGAAVQGVYSIPFVPTQDGLDQMLAAYHLDYQLDDQGNQIEPLISRAVTELAAQPAGSRAIVTRWIGFLGYGTDEHGVLAGMVDPVDSFGNMAEFYTIWSDRWQEELYAKYDDWFGRLRAAGGQVDVVVLDIECKSFSWRALTQVVSRFAVPSGRTVWQTIFQDPRWPPIEAELKAYGLTTAQLNSIATWNPKGTEALIWDAVMERRRAEYIDRAIFDALRRHFPNVRFSNYGNYFHSQTLPSGAYNRFTHSWASVGALVGTAQARSMFAWPREISTPTESFDSAPPSQAAIATIQGVNGLVTVTTYDNITGIRVGDPVRIYEQVPRGIEAYVGNYTVHQVLSATKFTFRKVGNYPLVTLPNATATGYSEFFNSYNAMIHDMKYVRTQAASADVPLQPWIAASTYSEMVRNLPFTYWVEQILHVALHDVDEIVFWNTPTAGMDPEGEGNVVLNNALIELQPLIGFADRRSLNLVEADWYQGYLLSGMEVNGVRIWRFTPDPKLSLTVSTGVNTTFTVNGTAVTIPNSYIYTPLNPVSTKGFWVVQTAGTTELTGTVDQILALLRDEVGGSPSGRGSGPIGIVDGDPRSRGDFFTGAGGADGARVVAAGEEWLDVVAGATTTVSPRGRVWSATDDWLGHPSERDVQSIVRRRTAPQLPSPRLAQESLGERLVQRLSAAEDELAND